MKILLMTHPIITDEATADNYGAFLPLGVGYLAAMLEKEGFDVCVLDCLAEGYHIRVPAGDKIRIGLADEEIARRVKEIGPDVAGISNNFTSYYTDAVALARLVKDTLPEAFVLAGGAHMTMDYDNAMENDFIDAVVQGEAEYTIIEIADALKDKGAKTGLAGIKGLIWRDAGGKVVVNEARPAPIDLDALPMPAYHLLNMKLYLEQKANNFAYSKRFPIGHMITSRGCLYRCIFCSTVKLFMKFRPRSPENVLAEMEHLVKNYGVKEIHFHDDSFLCEPERIEELCSGIIDRGLDINWQASQGVTVWGLNKELLELMQKSGMYRVGLPVESGSKKTLKFIRKPVNLEKTLEIIEQCNRMGIYTHGNFIIGFPYETKEDILETAEYIKKSNLDFVKLLICQPLAGSDLYDVYLNDGLLEGIAMSASNYENTKYDTAYFSADELNGMRDDIMKGFVDAKLKSLMTVSGIRRLVLPKLYSADRIGYFLKLLAVTFKRAALHKSALGI